MPNFDENGQILDRIKDLKGWIGRGSDTKLAEYLGVSAAILSHWRTRAAMDLWLLKEKLTQEEFIYCLFGSNENKPKRGLPPDMQRALDLARELLEEKPYLAGKITALLEGRKKMLGAASDLKLAGLFPEGVEN